MERHLLHAYPTFRTKACYHCYVCFIRRIKGVSLPASKWYMMRELIQILQPLEEDTQEISTEQRVSCSKVILLLNALLLELCKNVVGDETHVPDDDNHMMKLLF